MSTRRVLYDLAPGDCFADPGGAGERVFTELVVRCAEPHNQEVFSVFDESPGPYPGDAAIERIAQQRCRQAFTDYTGIDFDGSPFDNLFWLPPDESTWKFEDRRFICTAATTSNTTGSAKRSA